MQGRALIVFALLAAPVAASSATASTVAAAWLQSHKSPTEDQLKELAGANPEAYAVVSALLGKHMKHLRAHATEQSGADIFRSMMTPPHLAKPRAAVPYGSGETAMAPVVDQANYNVNAASDRDESAVSRLLGAVASMGGSKGKKISALLNKRNHKHKVANALEEDASLFADEAPPAPVKPFVMPVVQEQVAPTPPKPEAPHENSYLKGIDLSGDMPVVAGAHHAHAHKESSYLKGIDLSGSNSLQSFSFGDAEPAAPTPVPKKVVAPKPKKQNAFLKWLSATNKAPAPEEKPAAPAPPAKKENSYLASVKFFG